MPLIIGLVGKIGSGKTTVSNYLESKYQYSEYSFAGPIKLIGSAFGFEDYQLNGTQTQKLEVNKYWGISARHFLQKFGTDICRDILPNVIPDMQLGESGSPWINLFEIHVNKLIKKNCNVKIIISDVRFADEANAIKKMGGHLIRINMNAKNKIIDNTTTHSSEVDIDNIIVDDDIYNNETLDELYLNVDNILNTIIMNQLV
jgi:dephospho-CoA kinase